MKSQSIVVSIVLVVLGVSGATSVHAEPKISGPTHDIVAGEVKAALQRSNEQTQAVGLSSLMVEPIRRRSSGADGENQ